MSLINWESRSEKEPVKGKMLFLIEYDRPRGEIVTLESFEDFDRTLADEARLELELRLNLEESRNEVVLLKAVSEAALRRTHGRYFASLTELAWRLLTSFPFDLPR
jgi:hypothetical protein